jgi:hypothetical protein
MSADLGGAGDGGGGGGAGGGGVGGTVSVGGGTVVGGGSVWLEPDGTEDDAMAKPDANPSSAQAARSPTATARVPRFTLAV